MKPLFLLLLHVLLPILLLGQAKINFSNGYLIEAYSDQEGFPGNSARDILEDAKGFLWMATHDGLVRYDGNEFKLYKPDLTDTVGYLSNFITDLDIDNKGRIWLGTFAGLQIFDPARESFFPVIYPPEYPASPIYSIKEIKPGFYASGSWFGLQIIEEVAPLKFKITEKRAAYAPALHSEIRRLRRDNNILLDIQHPTIKEHKRSFTIDRPTRVLIAAFGRHQPDRNLLYNNAIVKELTTSDTIFQLNAPDKFLYADTSLAGGEVARIESKVLKPGAYEVFYRSVLCLVDSTSYADLLGLHIIEISEEDWQRLQPLIADENLLLHPITNLKYKDTKGQIWFPNNAGLTRIDSINGSDIQFAHYNLQTPEHKQSILITQSFLTGHLPDDQVYLTTTAMSPGGNIIQPYVTKFNPKDGRFERTALNFGRPADLRRIAPAKDDKFWLGTWGQGLYLWSPESVAPPKSMVLSAETKQSSENFYIWSLLNDTEGNTWVGTWLGNVYKMMPSRVIKAHYAMPDLLDVTTSAGKGGRALVDKQGIIYIASRTGISCLDRNKGQIVSIDEYYGVSINSRTRGFTIPLLIDSKDNFWIGSPQSTLIRFNLKSKAITQYKFNVPVPVFPLRLEEVAENQYWIAAADGRIFRLDDSEQASKMTLAYRPPALRDFWSILDMRKDKAGNLFVGRGGSDFLKISKEGGEHKIVQEGKGGGISAFCIGKEGYLWTYNQTYLYKVKPDDLSIVKKFKLDTDYLYVSSIERDRNGNLWIASRNGLYYFDIKTEQFRRFSVFDKLIGNRPVLISKLTENELIVYVDRDIYIIDTDQVGINSVAPRVQLTNFKIANKDVEVGEYSPLQQSITYTSDMQLKYGQNDIAIGYTGISYASNASQFQYKLDGVNDDWVEVGTERIARFADLPPGSYTFRVRAANADGVWSEQETTLQIRVLPPWWRTWWAYVLYGVLLFGGIYYAYQFQLNKKLAEAEAYRLRELDSVKTKLYTNITHEFRTPLTIMLGMAEQLRDQVSEHVKESLAMIKRNGRQLLELVNQMLDLSKLESGHLKLEYEQGDIINYLQYLMESFHSLAESKQIRLHFISDLKIYYMDYDPVRLMHVISNLLSNAIKFTPAGRDVYISVGIMDTPEKKQCLSIKIKDTGIGIPEEKLPYIFDRFYQVDDSVTRKGEGTGIGLTLARELVKLMHGQIVVKSELGKGSEFTVLLPITKVHNIKTREERKPMVPIEEVPADLVPIPHDLKENKPLMLIVEDNPDLVKYLINSFNSTYNLEVAYNGEQGIDKAIHLIPDIIITDVMMPEKDGFELCNTLKNHELTSHVPIIMLTAKVDTESRLIGLRRGADAYLAKPFLQEELKVRVRALLAQRQRLQAYYRAQAGITSEKPQEEQPLNEEATLENVFLSKVNQIIEANLNNSDFSVEMLSEDLFVSTANLYRKLKALTGMSPNQYIRAFRLSSAKILLQDPNHTIADIAYATGFTDPDYFSRLFKKETGVTPSEYRNAEKT